MKATSRAEWKRFDFPFLIFRFSIVISLQSFLANRLDRAAASFSSLVASPNYKLVGQFADSFMKPRVGLN
jgi:hypothetical protein